MRRLATPPVASAAAIARAPLLESGEQSVRGLAEQRPGGLLVEGVEGPLPAPLLVHQSRVLELPHVVGDLRLAHAEDLLELADADGLLPLFGGDAGGRKVTAAATIGHHGEHPHPYRVRDGAPQGYELLHPFLSVSLAGAILLHDSELLSAHSVPCSIGFRPLMKALASGTSAAAVAVAVSPQQPEPPQQPEASAN